MAAKKKTEVKAAVEHTSIAHALLAVQAEVPALQKDKVNPHYGHGYISLDTLMPEILPILSSNGLLLFQLMDHVGEEPSLRTTIVHVASGETIEGNCPMKLDRQNAQGVGSATTYYRRYGLMSALGLVADADDDGAKASLGGTPTPTGTPPVGVAASAYSADPFGGSGVPGGLPA